MLKESLPLGGGVPPLVYIQKLLIADWKQTDGPLRLAGDLPLSAFAEADFFNNLRVFLAALDANGGTPTTATGNLNREFVGLMFERLKLDRPYRNSIRTVCKVVNELDLWPLHLVRVIGECAGLVARRRKRFQLTKLGRSLLPDSQAGPLFRNVFIAYFRRFDLRYDCRMRDVPGIQQTISVVLWRLDELVEKNFPVRGLAVQVLLPGVMNQLRRAMTSEYDREDQIFAGYVLNPLRRLGLLETKGRGEWPCVEVEDVIRTTPLWRKFIQFT
jgi:hypothetical protein